MSLESIFALLTLLVAVVATAGGFYSVYTARKTARQQATLELLEKYKSEVRAHHAHELAAVLGNTGEPLPAYTMVDKMEFILILVNKAEMGFIGSRHKIYDREMVLDALAVEMIKVYAICKPLIEKAREKGSPESELYEQMLANFEPLVEEAKARFAKK